ncbi:MAG: glutamate-5-semialdehyde dehydrogenase [Planctomycetota bacterium]|nr:MAG: glutamate-5-semialdehyde dehydrogenase [Planctomycetota bacterium]
MTNDAIRDVLDAARAAQRASRWVGSLPTRARNAALEALAGRLESSRDEILHANARDVADARAAGIGDAKIRRLALSPESIAALAEGVQQVAALPDPIGAVTRETTTPAGLRVRKVRAPLGVVMMIYESRPGVTVDAFSLCFKAGNACILKGGREAARSNEALARCVRESLRAIGAGADEAAAMTLVTTSDRDAIRALLALEGVVDLAIPRGGEALIRFVHEHARVPTVQHFHGVCHVFAHAAADQAMALDVIATAKTSAPATCNAVECALIDEPIAGALVPRLARRAEQDGFTIRGDRRVVELAGASPAVTPADERDWGREFLDLTLAVRVVAGLDGAVEHIARYGSRHTEAIITEDAAAAEDFVNRVDASCTLVNASTRFNDGFQLGLGAEIGISTSKIHAYGPMGLEELTTQRWVVLGSGQTR